MRSWAVAMTEPSQADVAETTKAESPEVAEKLVAKTTEAQKARAVEAVKRRA